MHVRTLARFLRNLIIAPAALGVITGIASAALDQDTDGMSDLWEAQVGFSITSSNLPGQGPSQDPDGDGASNQLESIAGTDPRSNAPISGVFQATTAANATNQMATNLQWQTFRGKNYQVLASTDLTAGSWTAIAGSFTATASGPASYTTPPGLPAESRKFFKISVRDTDPDNDDLTTSEELSLNTSPYLTDTDGDSVNDKVEVIQGSSPTDATDNGLPPIPPALLPLKVKIFTYASLGATYPSTDGLLTPYTLKIFE